MGITGSGTGAGQRYNEGMTPTYSIKKGFWKAVVSLLAIGGGLLTYAGLSEMTVLNLLEQFLPTLLSLTVGGAITLATNFIKVNFLN